ncbi:unnamed protein product [Amoebophrya sp. A120]|nr:unnamed protein product [Amoebophrya sp. A120]|eukprot:GSA120T00020895001.1
MKLASGPACQQLGQIAIQVIGYEVIGQQDHGGNNFGATGSSYAQPFAAKLSSMLTNLQNRVTQYVVYEVAVEAEGLKWTKKLRFSHFSMLLELLQSRYNNIPSDLFPRKTLVRSVEAQHLNTRVRQLNEFFLVICRNRLDILRTCVELWQLFDFHVHVPDVFGVPSRAQAYAGATTSSTLGPSPSSSSTSTSVGGLLYQESVPALTSTVKDAFFGVKDFHLDTSQSLLILATNDYSMQSKLSVAAEGGWRVMKEGVARFWGEVSSQATGGGSVQRQHSNPQNSSVNNPMYWQTASPSWLNTAADQPGPHQQQSGPDVDFQQQQLLPPTSQASPVAGVSSSSTSMKNPPSWRVSLHHSDDRPMSALTCYKGSKEYHFDQQWRVHFQSQIQCFCARDNFSFVGLKDGTVGVASLVLEAKERRDTALLPRFVHAAPISAIGCAPELEMLNSGGSSAAGGSSGSSRCAMMVYTGTVDGKISVYSCSQSRILAELLLPLSEVGSSATVQYYATVMKVHGRYLFVGTNLGSVVIFTGVGSTSLQLHRTLVADHVRESNGLAIESLWHSPVAVRDLLLYPVQLDERETGSLYTNANNPTSTTSLDHQEFQPGQKLQDLPLGVQHDSATTSNTALARPQKSPDVDPNLRLFVALRDGIQVWLFPECRQVGYQSKNRDASQADSSVVRCITLRESTRELLVGFDDGTVASYDLESSHQLSAFPAHFDEVKGNKTSFTEQLRQSTNAIYNNTSGAAVAHLQNSRTTSSSSGPSTAEQMSVMDQQAQQAFGHYGCGTPVTRIEVIPNTDFLLTSGKDRCLKIWRCPDGENATGSISRTHAEQRAMDAVQWALDRGPGPPGFGGGSSSSAGEVGVAASRGGAGSSAYPTVHPPVLTTMPLPVRDEYIS